MQTQKHSTARYPGVVGAGSKSSLLVWLVWALLGPGGVSAAIEGEQGVAEANQACLQCHADADIKPETERGKKLQLQVSEKALFGSVHESLRCTDCHGGATTFEEAPHNGGNPLTLNCNQCHQQAVEGYEQGVHGRATARGDPQTPTCVVCHGGHHIVPLVSKESPLARGNQPETCGKCHGSDVLTSAGISMRQLIDRYYRGVHWRAVQEGKKGAVCSDCHRGHAILPSSDANSSVNRIGVLKTCDKCHADIVKLFSSGSHGRSLLHGNLDVPNCITCHGDHDIISLKTQAGQSRNYAGTEICIWCHGNQRMMARYALDTSPVESYMKDFHGLTQRGTSGMSATCADCHDAHRSLPSSHPESRMHISNRGAACGQCHGQSNESFIMSFTHKMKAVDHGGDVKQVITTIYLVLIFLIIGGMLLHNFILWWHAFVRKYRHQKLHGRVKRLNAYERAWHWLLLVSFLLLLLSGLALKYPDSIWFRWLYSAGMTEALRALLHRLSAIVLIVNTVAFIGYQLFSRPGKKWLKPMLPRWRDFRDFAATMRFYLGRSEERPRYQVFSYVEKAEYWALLWGTVIMVLTGLVLWFPKSVPAGCPSWVIDVARIIHFMEAVLASLAVLVWHLFHTVFKVDEYPMDTSWLTGSLTEEEARLRFTEEAILAQMPPPPKPLPPPEPPSSPEKTQDAASGATGESTPPQPQVADSKKEDEPRK